MLTRASQHLAARRRVTNIHLLPSGGYDFLDEAVLQ